MIIYVVIFLIFICGIMLIYFRFREPFNQSLPYIDLGKPLQTYFISNFVTNTPTVPLTFPLKNYNMTDKLDNIFIYNPKYFTPVRNQGDCGACWAFVICGMLSDAVTIRIIKFKKNLSVQELLTCYPSTDGCQGADPQDVLKWLEKTQFKLSINDDYKPNKRHNCDHYKTNGIQVEKGSLVSLCTYIKEESTEKLDKKILNQNIYNMKTYIKENGPIYSAITAYSDFIHFSGDRIYKKESDDNIGGHAVEIVGWCDKGVDVRESFKDGYWVCKNSWGTDWSKEYDFPGYFAIRMGYNECGIESRTGSASPNVDYILREKDSHGNLAFKTYDSLIQYITQK